MDEFSLYTSSFLCECLYLSSPFAYSNTEGTGGEYVWATVVSVALAADMAVEQDTAADMAITLL